MKRDPNPEEPQGPVFLLADDDKPAADRIASLLYPGSYYIVPVTNPSHVLSYAKRMRPFAIFMAEPISFPKGGALALLRRLIDEVGRPVIVLVELWTPQLVARWKSLGAADCLPHPTRSDQRLELVRSKMQELAIPTLPEPKADRPGEN